MLTLDRIMEIATAHAQHCTSPGAVGGEHHNIQVLSVAIQEALSENDDEKKPFRRPKALRQALAELPRNAKLSDPYSGS
jgi:hypothetical protein